MKNFNFTTIGRGKINIIILSGWGINAKIWLCIAQKLKFFFTFYLIDLPGSGENQNLPPMKIDQIIQILYYHVPKNSIWMGWSMGGLIASYFALSYPEYVLSVISVASSPCFIEKDDWPGIKKDVIYNFYTNLKTQYYKTICELLNCQNINSKKHLQDITVLKNILCSESRPSLKLLKYSLEMIFLMDLRLNIPFIKIPFLRIYGALDSLVPKKIINILDRKWPKTHSVTIEKAAHTPFISHKNEFCSILLNFTKLF